MVRLVRFLLRAVPKLLNQLYKICWLVPVRVSNDERILRAIYTPLYFNEKNQLKVTAFHPTPKTDEISAMRLEYMGPTFCKVKAKSIANPAVKKNYCGFAVLEAGAPRKHAMDVLDSRKRNYCGHADIKLHIEELVEPQEPPSAVATERLLQLKRILLKAANYQPDPVPHENHWRGGRFAPREDSEPVEGH